MPAAASTFFFCSAVASAVCAATTDAFAVATADCSGAQSAAQAFILDGAPKRVRRRLERPFGSVRWRADSPDPQQETVGYLGP